MSIPTLQCTGISVVLNRRPILHDITFGVHTRELVVILGPNGAGKSTLLSVLAGDLKATSGEVQIGQRAITEFDTHQLANLRAVMPQQINISFPFSVQEIVEMGRGSKLRKNDQQLVESAMAQVGVLNLRNRLFRTLSVGEQARVSMARILAQDTDLLLLDEPTAVLDIGQQEKLMKIIRSLADTGKTIVAVVHDLNLAMAFADRVVILHDGRQVASGSPREIMTSAVLSETYRHKIDVLSFGKDTNPIVIPSSRNEIS